MGFLVLVFVLSCLGLRFDFDNDGQSSCLCALKKSSEPGKFFRRNGQLHRVCSCNVAFLNAINENIQTSLKALTRLDFFRFFRADLFQSCSLFPDDAKCERKECAAENESTSESDLEKELSSVDRSIGGRFFLFFFFFIFFVCCGRRLNVFFVTTITSHLVKTHRFVALGLF